MASKWVATADGTRAVDVGRIRIFSPIFGALYLNERPLTEQPGRSVAIGYVRLEGRDNPVLALWQKGEWRNHRGKPLRVPVLSWFKVEREDGTNAF